MRLTHCPWTPGSNAECEPHIWIPNSRSTCANGVVLIKVTCWECLNFRNRRLNDCLVRTISTPIGTIFNRNIGTANFRLPSPMAYARRAAKAGLMRFKSSPGSDAEDSHAKQNSRMTMHVSMKARITSQLSRNSALPSMRYDCSISTSANTLSADWQSYEVRVAHLND